MRKWIVVSAIAGAVAAGVVVLRNKLAGESDDVWTDATEEDVWPSQ